MNSRRWSASIIALHWLTVAVVSLAVIAVFTRELVADRPTRMMLLNIHRSSGLLVLGLFFARVILRCLNPRQPGDARDWTDWTDWAAQGAHTVLYALLSILPILGWALSNARGQSVVFLGVALPKLIPERNPDLAYTLQDFHSSAAWILMAIVVLHVLAALWHQFIRRDGILSEMLPERWQAMRHLSRQPPDRKD